MLNRLINGSKKINSTQRKILELLERKTYQQKNLAEALNISGAGLLYNLNKLEDETLIEKKTIAKVGNVSLNEISLNPNSYQIVRNILGQKQNKFTLITGFGKDSSLGKSYNIPIKSIELLKDQNYKLDKVLVFITPESNIKEAKKFCKFDEIYEYPYLNYRNSNSKAFEKLDEVIKKEQKENNLILDITPLTKLLSIKMFEMSVKYKIPSFYLGKKENGDDFLLWIYQN